MSILVYTENWDGKFKKSSFELVSYASKLAEMMNTTATALSVGNVDKVELEKLAKYGADKIVNATGNGLAIFDTQAYTHVITRFAQKTGADIIILSNNNTGKALAPRLSVKLKAGIGSGVNKLPISIDPFVVCKRAYSGNAFAHLMIKTSIRIITLAQNSFELIEKNKNVAIEDETVNVDGALIRTVVKDVQKQSGKILLTDADIVVSGGRGMKSPDNWGPLIELAGLLGAATACSRPVSDEGWRGHEEHTGQTGKIISPNLYIAIGISGATQHLAGVSSSKYIVAVNIDKDAPIFEVAQYGIVGDAMKVLPKLIEAYKEMKVR
jgi:electron transfer flavoprotein alpha subunit